MSRVQNGDGSSIYYCSLLILFPHSSLLIYLLLLLFTNTLCTLFTTHLFTTTPFGTRTWAPGIAEIYCLSRSLCTLFTLLRLFMGLFVGLFLRYSILGLGIDARHSIENTFYREHITLQAHACWGSEWTPSVGEI